jgi:chromosome segregation ATPase
VGFPLKNDRTKAERELISGTISDLHESIQELEDRIEYFQQELQARKKRLETWRHRLAVLADPSDPSERRRRPKGENLRAVIGVLQNCVNGLTAAEIQRKTELPWSSIQATLKRHPELFAETAGLWRLNMIGATLNGSLSEEQLVTILSSESKREEEEDE